MKESIYIDMLNKKIKTFTEQFENIDDADHGHMKGAYTESMFRSLLNDFLPSNIELSHGWRVDENGNESHERDILLYDKNSLPPFLFSAATGLVPLASIKYDIEVKSSLSKDKMDTALEQDNFDKRCPKNAIVGLKGKEIFEYYTDYGKKTDEIPIIKLLCTGEDACYYWHVQSINILDEYKKYLIDTHAKFFNNADIAKKIQMDLLTINNIKIPPKDQLIRVCRWLKFESNSIKMFVLNILNDLYSSNQPVISYLATRQEQEYKIISKAVFDAEDKLLFHEYNLKDGIQEKSEEAVRVNLEIVNGKIKVKFIDFK